MVHNCTNTLRWKSDIIILSKVCIQVVEFLVIGYIIDAASLIYFNSEMPSCLALSGGEELAPSFQFSDVVSFQFADETFNVVLDKGGLDALMEPELGTDLGNRYLSEVSFIFFFNSQFMISRSLINLITDHSQFTECLFCIQVKRVLKDGGKFICLTLAEAHVLGIAILKLCYLTGFTCLKIMCITFTSCRI